MKRIDAVKTEYGYAARFERANGTTFVASSDTWKGFLDVLAIMQADVAALNPEREGASITWLRLAAASHDTVSLLRNEQKESA